MNDFIVFVFEERGSDETTSDDIFVEIITYYYV